MKKWVAAAVALLLVAGGFYFGSPYLAVRALQTAAAEGDKDALEQKVDFPAVRESLKSQMSAALMTKMQTDPEMKDNPFAALGAALLPTMINGMVDAFVTPDAIAAMVRGQKPSEKATSGSNPDIASETEWVGLDRFRVKLRNTKTDEEGPSLLFERRGFASWKLIKMELPPTLFDKPRPA